MPDQSQHKNVSDLTAEKFYEKTGASGKMKFLLGYAVMAPSSHNTQPWKFRVAGDDAIEVYADKSRQLVIADADKRELYISVGCALENLLIAAAHFEYETMVEYFPQDGDENFVARALFKAAPSARRTMRAGLFEFIPRRATFHGTFENRSVPANILHIIGAYAGKTGVCLHLTADDEIRRRIDELIARSDAAQFADRAFRAELSFWIGQGAFGNGWLTSQIGRLAVAYLDLGKMTARNDSRVLRSAPVIGLLKTKLNDRRSQVEAGQVFERIYLAARRFGLGVRPMSQICQIPEHKHELKNLIGSPHDHPQQPFLLGYAETSVEHTPRRRVEEVLI